MKLLIDADTYMEAMLYAGLSTRHTHFHKGWEQNTMKQFLRIANGQIAQKFVVRLLRANGVEVEEDGTEYTDNDIFDFKIKGLSFDVKCSSHGKMPMQITLPAKDKMPSYYVFCRISPDAKIIDIKGVVSAKEATKEQYFVAHRQVIPDTALLQQFEHGSFFYTGAYKSFNEIVKFGLEKIEAPIREPTLPAGQERSL